MTTARTPAESSRLERWLRIDARAKPAVYLEVYRGADFSGLGYWLGIAFSAGIATFGLVLSSPAVIIGAMLISPLMGPIMALGLGLAVADLYLALKAIANLAASIAFAVGLSAAMVWLLPFQSVTPEILARTNPNLLDLGIALFSGLAGSVAVCRPGGQDVGSVPTLPGVAIAVALMPPLCTLGFGLGAGANGRIMGGAGLLFLTNLVAIVASAFAVFLLVRMNAPEVRASMGPARESELFARRLARSPVGRVLSDGAALHWRILLLAVLLGSLAVPLHTALRQVAHEALARDAVQSEVKKLLPPDARVSQQVEVGRGNVAVRLVSTAAVSDAAIRQAEEQIRARSGLQAQVTVATVASQNELAQLTDRLEQAALPQAAPAPPPPALGEIHDTLLARVTPVIKAVWPAEAPLQDFSISFSRQGMAIEAHYGGPRALTPVSLGLLTKALEDKLNSPGLTLKAEHVTRPRRRRR